jgi:hypothetical protein
VVVQLSDEHACDDIEAFESADGETCTLLDVHLSNPLHDCHSPSPICQKYR